MQPQLHHCWQSSGLSYTAWHMNSQWPLKKKEDLKGNSSNLRMTDPMPVKPVVSVEGVPCQPSLHHWEGLLPSGKVTVDWSQNEIICFYIVLLRYLEFVFSYLRDFLKQRIYFYLIHCSYFCTEEKLILFYANLYCVLDIFGIYVVKFERFFNAMNISVFHTLHIFPTQAKFISV